MKDVEYITRKENPNATEDYVRGSVWAYDQVWAAVMEDKSIPYYIKQDVVLGLEKGIPDMIAAQKESFEFNRGAEWSFNRFALQVAKDEQMACGDIMNVIMGFGCDRVKDMEALISYQERKLNMPPEHFQKLRNELERIKNIDKTKGW